MLELLLKYGESIKAERFLLDQVRNDFFLFNVTTLPYH